MNHCIWELCEYLVSSMGEGCGDAKCLHPASRPTHRNSVKIDAVKT